MAETVQHSPTPARSSRRSLFRHWTVDLLIAGITLFVVVIIVVQLVLNTTIPREIVIAQVQKTLGLHVTAEQVSTGWLGHTTLRNVVVSLPLAEHAFLEMPELRVDHTILPILLITQSLDIKSIALDKPKIYVTQDRDGRWNLQDVVQILARIGGNGQSTGGQSSNQKSASLVLPQVELRDGEIDVKDNSGRQINVTPLNVSGKPVNSLVWEYDATCDSDSGAHIKLVGRIAPNDSFSHEVDFTLSDLQSLAKPWIANFDPAAIVKGEWRGTQTADGVAGRLKLQTFKYQNISAEQGDISIATTGAQVTATAARLIVRAGADSLESLAITGGSLSLDASSAKANALQISALNGRVLIDGSFGFADQSGNLHGEWKTLQPTPAISSSGSFDASLRSNWPDQRAVKVDLSTTGIAADNNYNAVIQLTGGGKTWDTANWIFTAPTLKWSGKQSVALDHLIAHIATTPGQLTLTDVTVPGTSSVIGGGGLRFDEQHPLAMNYTWWLFLQGQNWAIPKASEATLAFGINAWGDQAQIRLKQAFGVVGRIYAGLDGYYRFTHPEPVDLNLSISELPAPIGNAPDIIQGKVRGEGVLVGTIFPLSLDANGQLHGEQIVFDNRPPQEIAVKCTAGLHKDHFAFDTEELSLLGGQWSLHGQIPSSEKAHGNVPDITIRVHDLPMANLADLVHQKDVTGTAAGSLEVDIDEPTLNQIAATGHFDVNNVQARQFKADSITTDVSIRNGLLVLFPINFKLGDGHAQAKLSTHLSNPLSLTASLEAKSWPVDAGPAHAVVSASTDDLSIDAKAISATGNLKFSASAQLRDRPLLTADGAIGLNGRVINLQKLTAKILDGDASGSATVDIDHPLTSTGTLRWDLLNLNELASYNDVYATASGFLTGRADLAPTTDPRALGPLMLDIASVGQSVKFRSVQFTQLHLPIFFSGDRVVLSGGKVNVADGEVDLFARASLHDQQTLSTQTQATLDGLDLQQLFHAADKTEAEKTKTYPGRLSGTISVVGDPRDKLQLFGQASLQIHDSDLGNLGPFAVLYDTMHLGGSAGKKIGEGTIEARYDNDSLIVSSLRYFNRGIDAYGLAAIKNISKYPICDLSGELVGTYSPLRNIKLPFFADADKIFSVLQSNLTSIVIGGTIAKPSYLPESAAAIGTTMRSFLMGDVESKEK